MRIFNLIDPHTPPKRRVGVDGEKLEEYREGKNKRKLLAKLLLYLTHIRDK